MAKCKEFVDLRGHMVGHASLHGYALSTRMSALPSAASCPRNRWGLHRRLVPHPTHIFPREVTMRTRFGGQHAHAYQPDAPESHVCNRKSRRTPGLTSRGIDVEKPLSVRLHTADDAIVERPLHHIGISSVLLRL